VVYEQEIISDPKYVAVYFGEVFSLKNDILFPPKIRTALWRFGKYMGKQEAQSPLPRKFPVNYHKIHYHIGNGLENWALPATNSSPKFPSRKFNSIKICLGNI
jgi:hypothetical protein